MVRFLLIHRYSFSVKMHPAFLFLLLHRQKLLHPAINLSGCFWITEALFSILPLPLWSSLNNVHRFFLLFLLTLQRPGCDILSLKTSLFQGWHLTNILPVFLQNSATALPGRIKSAQKPDLHFLYYLPTLQDKLPW